MPSLNLLRYDEVRKEAGGELRILLSYLDNPRAASIYHNCGLMLGSLEDLVIGLIEVLGNRGNLTYLHSFAWDSLEGLQSQHALSIPRSL